MARLLVLFIIAVLVTTQGTSMAAAVCRHSSAQEHVLAAESGEAEAVNGSLAEESAAAAAAKKGSPGFDPSSQWPAQLLPADLETAPARHLQRLSLPAPPAPALVSLAVLPLLEPPSA